MNANTLKTIVGLFVVLILGSLAYLYFLIQEAGDRWPMENEPGSLVQQIGTLRGSITQLRGQEAQIPGQREVLAAITVDYDLAQTVLPRESSPDQLIAAIRTKAQQAGVVPTSLAPSIMPAGARGAGGPFEIWRFSLALTGSFDQIGGFINRMEEFESPDAARTGSERRFFEVLDIDITAEDNGLANLGGDGVITPLSHRCALVMQTYRYTGE